MKGRLVMKREIFVLLLFVAVVVFLSTKSALGYTVTVLVEGVVIDVQTWGGLELDDSVIAGSTIITGSCTYDSETLDKDTSEEYGYYSPISVSITAGNYTFTHNPLATEQTYFSIYVGSSAFYYDMYAGDALFFGPCYLNGQPTTLEDLDLGLRGISWDLTGYNDGTLTDALPDENTFPDLSVFTKEKLLTVSNDVAPASFAIAIEITSLTVVPEPASAVLLGMGAIAVILRRKRR